MSSYDNMDFKIIHKRMIDKKTLSEFGFLSYRHCSSGVFRNFQYMNLIHKKGAHGYGVQYNRIHTNQI